MSRPAATTIISQYDAESDTLVEICEGETPGYFAVMYLGRSFQLRKKSNAQTGYPPLTKYGKVCFPSHAHAKNLAQRLNDRFNTQDFTVIETTTGRTITVD